MKRAKTWFLALAAASLAAAMAAFAQGIAVCPSCGRETRPGETACSHCGAKLPPAKPEKAPEPKPAAAPEKQPAMRIAELAVRENLRMVRELEEQRPSVALCYAQNALALQRLVPADRKIGDEILQAVNRLGPAAQQGWTPCRFCNGKGRMNLVRASHDGTRTQGPMRTCKACGGAGGRRGLMPPDRAKMQLMAGRREFEQQRMLAGDVRMGRAFVPAALDAALKTRERALVMTGAPTPCPECQFTKRQMCTACKGTGLEKCSNPDCKNGILEGRKSPLGRKETAIDEAYTRVCKVCGGTGKILCRICNGSCGVPCRKCSGSGLAPECRKCSGAGYVECPRCKGSGKTRGATCQECGGEGIELCPTCRGEGAISR